MASMGGKSASRTAGAAARLGPTPGTGPIRIENTGSVNQLARLVRIKKVEWPTQVALTPSPVGAGGGRTVSTGTVFGHGTGRLVRRQRIKSRSPCSGVPPGWKNVFPLK
jgi:hypothetical protein